MSKSAKNLAGLVILAGAAALLYGGAARSDLVLSIAGMGLAGAVALISLPLEGRPGKQDKPNANT